MDHLKAQLLVGTCDNKLEKPSRLSRLVESLRAELGRLVQIRGKAMADRSGDLLELFRDVLLEARLDDRERFRQVSCSSVRTKREGC